ncbi:MAG: T9SS type A sorting domain-containing protein [Bacteroidetes bacterium]|nr:T9SS type A sorting domain-containing protein [Bacteroidota bacterium]MBS1931612.1 T9SS type A sorting domain-containing protein [Bacteroidota bacterium]
MKTLYSKLVVMVLAFAMFQTKASAQDELVFKNSSLKSGTAGANGAVYLFPFVNSLQDALVTITDRSSSLVKLTNIDITNTGFDKSFQPQVNYNNGNVSGVQDWWIEFSIAFVDHNTSNPSSINSFNVTAIDIDGNGSRLREYDAFFSPASYVVENNTALTITNLVVNNQTVGKTFTAALPEYGGIDTVQKKNMVTLTYNNVNTLKVRFGGTTSGSVNDADRMYSIWFKNFSYSTPLKVLPVKLVSFDATLNNKNKVDLSWITATEINVNQFVVQKSTDGVNYSDAGLVFAVGNSTQNVNYKFSDDISNVNATVIYYRLCSVDNDGKTSYSEVRVIRISKQGENTVGIITYPNPVSNQLQITVPATWQNKKVSFELFNANGQMVKRTDNSNSSQTETINVNELGRGLYIVRVSCNGETAQQKIIKN